MISVCIPTYNGEKYISCQLTSILEQLGEKDEIIISDDSSTDETINIIKSYNDRRIVVLENNNYKSPIFNLENALKYAKGEYIFLSDQDDIWLKEKIIITMQYLKMYDVVVSDCFIVNEKKEIISESFYKVNNSKKGFLNNVTNNSYLGCCMAFKKELLLYALPFPHKIAMHDIWLGLITELLMKSIFIKEPLIYYRRHHDNYSPTAEKSKFNFIYKIKYRLIFLYLVVSRYLKLFAAKRYSKF